MTRNYLIYVFLISNQEALKETTFTSFSNLFVIKKEKLGWRNKKWNFRSSGTEHMLKQLFFFNINPSGLYKSDICCQKLFQEVVGIEKIFFNLFGIKFMFAIIT